MPCYLAAGTPRPPPHQYTTHSGGPCLLFFLEAGEGVLHVRWSRAWTRRSLLVPQTGPKTGGLGGWGSGVCILVDVNCVPNLLVTNRIRHMPGGRPVQNRETAVML